MKIQLLMLIWCLLLSTAVYSLDNLRGIANEETSFNMQLIQADKELKSVYVSKSLGNETITELSTLGDIDKLKADVLASLKESLEKVQSFERQCDLTLAAEFKNSLNKRSINTTDEFVRKYIILLRHNQLIDDLLFDIIDRSNRVTREFKLNLLSKANPVKLQIKGKEFDYKVFAIYNGIGDKWPDGVKACPLETIRGLMGRVKGQFELKKMGPIYRKTRSSSYYALKKGHISLNNYKRIKVMLDEKVISYPFFLERYLDNIQFAKDKLSQELAYIRLRTEGLPEDETSDKEITKKATKFSNKVRKVKNKLTIRKQLYKKFNSTQIMLLSEVMLRTIRGMNMHKSEYHRWFEDTEKPAEVLTLPPMTEYQITLDLLHQDFRNLQLMDTFSGVNISYDDVIMAAYETGVINADELDMVISFEDFWNPKKPFWKSLANFALGFASSATFYLPPPWNVVGAIAIIFTETVIYKNSKKSTSKYNYNKYQ